MECYDEFKSSHITEAFARACHFKSHAALLAHLKCSDNSDPSFVLVDEKVFVHRLHQLASKPVDSEEEFFLFDYFAKHCDTPFIITKSLGYDRIDFATLKDKAWRNTLVAALNAGIEKRIFSIRPGDNRWEGANNKHIAGNGCVYRFSVGDTPAIAALIDIGYDEISVHAALWPTPEVERWISVINPDLLAGEVEAIGWLERRDGAWLQVPMRMEDKYFACVEVRLASVAALNIEPIGFADRGSSRA